MDAEDFYSVEQAADTLELTPGRVRQMLRAGDLEGIPPGERRGRAGLGAEFRTRWPHPLRGSVTSGCDLLLRWRRVALAFDLAAFVVRGALLVASDPDLDALVAVKQPPNTLLPRGRR